VDGLVNPSNVNFFDPSIPRKPPLSYTSHPHVSGVPSPVWAVILVLACLALGLVGGVVQWERGRADVEQRRAVSMAVHDSLLQAQREDLGKLLADPQTRMVRLLPSDGSRVTQAVIAWNPAQQTGFLFCDQLPALDSGVSYEIWATRDAEPSPISRIDARPGLSVYRFRPDGGLNAVRRWEITAGPRSADAAPILVGVLP
jgi:hypothetical protein